MPNAIWLVYVSTCINAGRFFMLHYHHAILRHHRLNRIGRVVGIHRGLAGVGHVHEEVRQALRRTLHCFQADFRCSRNCDPQILRPERLIHPIAYSKSRRTLDRRSFCHFGHSSGLLGPLSPRQELGPAHVGQRRRRPRDHRTVRLYTQPDICRHPRGFDRLGYGLRPSIPVRSRAIYCLFHSQRFRRRKDHAPPIPGQISRIQSRHKEANSLDLVAYSIPLSAFTLSSTGGCVINSFAIPLKACGPNGLAMKRCAVALLAFFIGSPCAWILSRADANPSG